MSAVSIKTVESKKDLKAFVQFPLDLYKDCPYYVPSLFSDEMNTLNPEKNAMGEYSKQRLFLAYKDGKLAGRTAAIINFIANKDWKHQEVRFGWTDFIDDPEVSKALIDAVMAFGKEEGMNSISGPLGFTDLDNEGCVVEGFDDISSFCLKYNYPYYAAHFEALGLKKANDWLEYRIFVPDAVPEKVQRAAAIVERRYKLHIHKVSRKEVTQEDYGQKIFDLVNRTYCDLFDFTILPQSVIDQYVDNFLGLLDLDLVSMVEDEDGRLVAMGLTMPSLAKASQKCDGKLFPTGWWHLLKALKFKHDEALEMLLIAVDPEYRNKGVHALLFNDLIGNLIKAGFKYGESNAEMETNNSVQNLWNDYDKELKRRRRVYSMPL